MRNCFIDKFSIFFKLLSHIEFNHSVSIPNMREEINIDVTNNNPGNSIEELLLLRLLNCPEFLNPYI